MLTLHFLPIACCLLTYHNKSRVGPSKSKRNRKKSRSKSDKERRKPEQRENKSISFEENFLGQSVKIFNNLPPVGQSFSSRIQARKSCRDGNE